MRGRVATHYDKAAPNHLDLIKLACLYPAMVLAGREAFAPQDLPALLVTLDLVSYPGGWLFSSGG